MENVPPCTSSGLSWRERARVERSTMACCNPSTFFWSALRITGTIRPASSATAMPMLISLWKMMFVPSIDALASGKARSASQAARVMNGR